MPSLDRFGPCNCLVHASGARRAKAGACSAWFAGSRRGNAPRDQRNRHRLVPAGSGAKASLACEERQLVGCARASTSVAEVGGRRTRFKEAQPVGNGGCGRGPGSSGSSARGEREAQRRRRPASRWPSREAGRGPSRAFERTLRGRGFRSMEGTPDRFFGWLVHASRQEAVLAALEVVRERANGRGRSGEATGVSEALYARITAGRERPPR